MKMNKPYIIVFDGDEKSKDSKTFLEIIRSIYVAKIANNCTILINPIKETTSKEIYTKIKSKINFEIFFYVVEFDDFYGDLYTDAWNWLTETFPDISFYKIDENDDQLSKM